MGHPDFGEVFLCRCREEEFRDRSFDRLQKYSNLGPLSRITFEETIADGQSQDPDSLRAFRAALDASRSFAEDPIGWLVLMGPSSSGKTHLAAAIANRCIELGHTVFFMNVPDLLDHLRGTYGPDTAVTYDELFQQVRDAPVLVLDDLGAQSSTPWAQEKLFQVFNHRFNAALPTVITLRGNLKQIDEGLATRLQSPQLSQVYSLGPGGTSSFQQFGGLDPELRHQMTFAAYDVSGMNANQRQRSTLEAAFRAAQAYAKDPHGWLLLTGSNGCGKTHLAVSIANERLDLGETITFAFVPALLDHLRAAFAPDSRVAYDERFEQVKGSPLLILDDLGSESSTPWAEEKLYQIIVHRHNARLPTVITAGEDVRFKPSIASRLSDVRIVHGIEIDAPDYRTQQSKGRGAGKGGRPGSPR